MANPSIMYGLFSQNSRKLQYDSDKVKVLGTKDGMINQINIGSMEDLESFHEQILGVPLLMRVWVELVRNDYIGAAQTTTPFEGDLALLVDTTHPMIQPQLEKALDEARAVLQANGRFCIELDFAQSIAVWLRASYPRGYCSLCRVRENKARLFITNYTQPAHCLDCNLLWCLLFGPCWLLSAPCYKLFRRIRCRDIKVNVHAPVVRRCVIASTGKIAEVAK